MREVGIVVWKKFLLVALIIFWHYIFQRATVDAVEDIGGLQVYRIMSVVGQSTAYA